MIELVLASANPHKIKEINEISKLFHVKFSPVNESFNPIESSKTFEGNATIKANCAAKLMNKISLADDTGLCVEALNGMPGIYSARYAPTQEEKISKLLDELKKLPENKRNASFICSMVLIAPNGHMLHSTKGICEGFIATKPDGINGFGYDPIFYVNSAKKTMAKMTPQEKNTLSHRALALIPMLKWINENKTFLEKNFSQ